MQLIRKHAALIIHSLANETDRWNIEEHIVSLKDTNLGIWIGSSGFWFVSIWKYGETRSAFNLVEKRMIWNLARPLTMLKSSTVKVDWSKFIINEFNRMVKKTTISEAS